MQQSAAYDEYRARRVAVEHRLARLVQLGLRGAISAGSSQLYLAETCLVASEIEGTASSAVMLAALMLPTVDRSSRLYCHQGFSARFLGSAIINGDPAPEGTVVAALIDGVTVSTMEVDASGRYGNLQVPTAGAAVTFTIGGLPAAETATSEIGELGILNLTATGAAQPVDTPVPPTAAPASEQQGDSGGSCGSIPDRSFSDGAGDMALLILPLLGLVGWAGLRRKHRGS